MNSISLTLKPLKFYSYVDERMILFALNELEVSKDIELIDLGIVVHIHLNQELLLLEDFKTLIAVFIRYSVSLEQLKYLPVDQDTSKWFLDKQRDWY